MSMHSGRSGEISTAVRRRMFALLLVVSAGMSMAAVGVFDARGEHQRSLLELSNLVGPTAASLLGGRGLTACTEAMGTPGNPICFHGGRMPMATWVVAVGVKAMGDRYVAVTVAKTLLLLMPLELGIWMVCGAMPAWGWRRWAMAGLLLVPFGVTAFLADVTNLQVEEGYSYSLLALGVAVVLFGGRLRPVVEAVVFGGAMAGLYLAKSAMLPAVVVLTLAYALRVGRSGTRWVAVGLAMLAPVGWAVYQHHATGRYAVGTSLDGFNLHKGNNARFLGRYPPRAGDTLDLEDAELNRGRSFGDEWSFEEFHERAAVAYAEGHVGATLRGEARKLGVIFVGVRKVGSGASHGVVLGLETAGMVVFRMVLWSAMGIAVVWVVRGGAGRRDGAVFLLLVGAVAVPYVAGFAYTRHASVLLVPAVLVGCKALVGRGRAEGLH